MLDFQQKKKFRNVAYSRLSILLFALLLFFVARATFRVYEKEVESEKNSEQIRKELLSLKEREKNLTSMIARLNTPAGIEEEIRQKFPLAKKGENVAVIIADQGTTTEVEAVKSSFWAWLENIFK